MRPIPLLLILSALALPALSQAAVRVEVLQNRLAQPWGMAFLPDDQGILITLRGGELKRWQPGKGLSAPIAGVPQVWANGQGGLLDVALAPDFAQSRRVWLSYAESDASGKAEHRGGLWAVERGCHAADELYRGLSPAAEALRRQSFWRQAGVRRQRIFVYRAGRK